MTPQHIATQVLYELTDATFHVCGGNWNNINDLLDKPGTFGTLGDWVCAIASEWNELGESDSYADLAPRTNDLARGFLGLTEEQWCSLENLDLEHVRVWLNDFLKRHAEAA